MSLPQAGRRFVGSPPICLLRSRHRRPVHRRPTSVLDVNEVCCANKASGVGGLLERADVSEIGKLVGATVFESAVIASTFYLLQQLMGLSFFPDSEIFRKATVWLAFFFLAFRSRVFGVLSAPRPRGTSSAGMEVVIQEVALGTASLCIQLYTRPSNSGCAKLHYGWEKANKGFGDRKRPNWCPPGFVFGIVWSTIAVLRATSSMLVWEASGCNLFVAPLIAYGAHLSIGDTWNHITNVQCKLGVSALFNTLFVLPSAIAVDYLYFNVTETAGWVLFPMVCWLTIACVLVWSIWDLNDRQELLPTST